jgi:hypothetical protein
VPRAGASVGANEADDGRGERETQRQAQSTYMAAITDAAVFAMQVS